MLIRTILACPWQIANSLEIEFSKSSKSLICGNHSTSEICPQIVLCRMRQWHWKKNFRSSVPKKNLSLNKRGSVLFLPDFCSVNSIPSFDDAKSSSNVWTKCGLKISRNQAKCFLCINNEHSAPQKLFYITQFLEQFRRHFKLKWHPRACYTY